MRKIVDFFASGKVSAVSLRFLKVFDADLGGDASRPGNCWDQRKTPLK
jgi:hypothetical protein